MRPVSLVKPISIPNRFGSWTPASACWSAGRKPWLAGTLAGRNPEAQEEDLLQEEVPQDEEVLEHQHQHEEVLQQLDGPEMSPAAAGQV